MQRLERKLEQSQEMNMIETRENYIREMIGPRPREAHKGDFGRVLLVCGSVGMAGAAVLCAKAALKSGAGLVTVCLPEELFPILQTAVPEAMCIDREAITVDRGNAGEQADDLNRAGHPAHPVHPDHAGRSGGIDLDRFDCIAVGPGLRTGREQYRLVEHLLMSYHGPLVLDADGINCICEYGLLPERETYMGDSATQSTDAMNIPRRMTSILPDITARRKHPVILTPHPGEADRLLEHLGQKKYGELGREKAAEILAEETGAIVVLKGADTLVAAADTLAYGAGHAKTEPDVFINPTGNPGMATGGSGDVLTGVIAALAAGGLGISPMDAARTGVYIHGLAGDIAAREIGEIGMTAMDIANALPEAFRQMADR